MSVTAAMPSAAAAAPASSDIHSATPATSAACQVPGAGSLLPLNSNSNSTSNSLLLQQSAGSATPLAPTLSIVGAPLGSSQPPSAMHSLPASGVPTLSGGLHAFPPSYTSQLNHLYASQFGGLSLAGMANLNPVAQNPMLVASPQQHLHELTSNSGAPTSGSTAGLSSYPLLGGNASSSLNSMPLLSSPAANKAYQFTMSHPNVNPAASAMIGGPGGSTPRGASALHNMTITTKLEQPHANTKLDAQGSNSKTRRRNSTKSPTDLHSGDPDLDRSSSSDDTGPRGEGGSNRSGGAYRQRYSRSRHFNTGSSAQTAADPQTRVKSNKIESAGTILETDETELVNLPTRTTKDVHGNVLYHCGQCSCTFTRNSNLTRHKRIHLNMKRFQCDICAKKFMEKHHLVAHQRVHSENAKPHQCRMCSRAFADQKNLDKHERTHNDNFVKHKQIDGIKQDNGTESEGEAHNSHNQTMQTADPDHTDDTQSPQQTPAPFNVNMIVSNAADALAVVVQQQTSANTAPAKGANARKRRKTTVSAAASASGTRRSSASAKPRKPRKSSTSRRTSASAAQVDSAARKSSRLAGKPRKRRRHPDSSSSSSSEESEEEDEIAPSSDEDSPTHDDDSAMDQSDNDSRSSHSSRRRHALNGHGDETDPMSPTVDSELLPSRQLLQRTTMPTRVTITPSKPITLTSNLTTKRHSGGGSDERGGGLASSGTRTASALHRERDAEDDTSSSGNSLNVSLLTVAQQELSKLQTEKQLSRSSSAADLSALHRDDDDSRPSGSNLRALPGSGGSGSTGAGGAKKSVSVSPAERHQHHVQQLADASRKPSFSMPQGGIGSISLQTAMKQETSDPPMTMAHPLTPQYANGGNHHLMSMQQQFALATPVSFSYIPYSANRDSAGSVHTPLHATHSLAPNSHIATGGYGGGQANNNSIMQQSGSALPNSASLAGQVPQGNNGLQLPLNSSSGGPHSLSHAMPMTSLHQFHHQQLAMTPNASQGGLNHSSLAFSPMHYQPQAFTFNVDSQGANANSSSNSTKQNVNQMGTPAATTATASASSSASSSSHATTSSLASSSTPVVKIEKKTSL